MSEQFDRTKQSQKARREELAKWRTSQIHELTLPSGLHVKVRDIDMTDLLIDGRMPDSVLAMAEKASQTENSVDLAKIGMDIFKNQGPEFKKMLDGIVTLAMADPKISEKGDEDTIALDELTLSDKTTIMNFVNREVEQLRPFRLEADKPVEAVPHGDNVRPEA